MTRLRLFLGEGAKATATFRGALQADIDLNVRQGTQAAETGAELGASAHRWILAVLVLRRSASRVAIGWTIIRGISSPISAMAAAMHRLAGGDTAVEIVGAGRGDEIGAMAKAVEVFRQNAVERAPAASRTETAGTAGKHMEKQVHRPDQHGREEDRSGNDRRAGRELGSPQRDHGGDQSRGDASVRRPDRDAAKSAAAAAAQSLANAQTVASAAEVQLTAPRSMKSAARSISPTRCGPRGRRPWRRDPREELEALNEQYWAHRRRRRH